jgi:hypothetical protein
MPKSDTVKKLTAADVKKAKDITKASSRALKIATQHGLTQSEVEKLINLYNQFLTLAGKITFEDSNKTTFSTPFPNISIIRSAASPSGPLMYVICAVSNTADAKKPFSLPKKSGTSTIIPKSEEVQIMLKSILELIHQEI